MWDISWSGYHLDFVKKIDYLHSLYSLDYGLVDSLK